MQFYTKADAFERELALYSDPVLSSLMPARHDVLANSDGALRAPVTGLRLPPCIVLERGESLDEFARRVDFDFFTVMQARLRPIASHAPCRPAALPCLCSRLRIVF